MPRVIQVIETEVARGEGTVEDVFRQVTQYHTLDGEFLAERDPCRKNSGVKTEADDEQDSRRLEVL